jgi:Uncharacterized conserved protein
MNEENIDTEICVSFGRAPYFLLYETDTKEIKWLVNSAAESYGGAGIAAAQILADHGAEILITPRCGENAEKVLDGAKIDVYHSIDGTAQQNIDAFTAGKLSLLSEFHAGFHGHGRQ